MDSLLQDAVARLREETGLHVQLDGDVLCIIHQGEVFSIQLLARRGFRAAHAQLVREAASNSVWAIVTEHIGRSLAKQLRGMGIQFLDLSGNAYLSGAFGLVFLAGAPGTKHRAPEVPSASTYKVAYALLAEPTLREGTLREIAEVAGVGLGTAARAVRLLKTRGWLLGEPGHRELQVFELWHAFEHGFVDRLASKIEIGRFRPLTGLQEWLNETEQHMGPEVLLGGAAAAQKLGLDIHAATATLHVRSWEALNLSQMRLIPDAKGPVVVRSQFGTANGEGPLAHPILVRAELLLDRDERLDDCRAKLAKSIQRDLS